jgi:hypothetical protein
VRRILTALLLLGLLVVALPAAAQAVGAADACYEIDHSGDNDFGSPSVVRVFLTLPPEFAGTWVDLAADGASGPIFGAGEVGPDGLVVVELPLSSYGDHTIAEGIVDSGGADLALDVTGYDFVVSDPESICDPGDLVYVVATTTTPPPETTTTTPASEATTTTVQETTSTTAPATTTTTVAATEPPTEEESDSPGGGWGWAIPFFGGLIVLIGGVIVYRAPGAPCREEFAAWMAAQSACDAAAQRVAAARAACDEANRAVDDLRQERDDVCDEWPPACWGSDDGGWIEEAGRPDTRITQRDLHMRRMALGELWDRYQSGELSAEEVEDAWRNADTAEFREDMRAKDVAAKAKLERLDAQLSEAEAAAAEACAEATSAEAEAASACAAAAAAKAAYDACMGAATPTPPPPPTGGDDGGGEDPPTTGGTPPTAPPPDPTPYGEEVDEDPLCCPCGEWWLYGWTTGGIFGWGKEFSYVQFVCRCSGKWLTLESQSHRAGLALGGESSIFVGYLWGAPHAADIPQVWASNNATGWDFDVSLGPSISKGIKSVVKDVGTGAGWDYLKWAARNKIPASNFDPRRVRELMQTPGEVAFDTAKDQVVGQQMNPQLVVVPFGAGLQVGFWKKWCSEVEVFGYDSCGCRPTGWTWLGDTR